MNAPLLKERELFLSKKQAKGNGLRSLQMTADQLLYAIHYLSLTKVFIQLHIISQYYVKNLKTLWHTATYVYNSPLRGTLQHLADDIENS